MAQTYSKQNLKTGRVARPVVKDSNNGAQTAFCSQTHTASASLGTKVDLLLRLVVIVLIGGLLVVDGANMPDAELKDRVRCAPCGQSANNNTTHTASASLKGTKIALLLRLLVVIVLRGGLLLPLVVVASVGGLLPALLLLSVTAIVAVLT